MDTKKVLYALPLLVTLAGCLAIVTACDGVSGIDDDAGSGGRDASIRFVDAASALSPSGRLLSFSRNLGNDPMPEDEGGIFLLDTATREMRLLYESSVGRSTWLTDSSLIFADVLSGEFVLADLVDSTFSALGLGGYNPSVAPQDSLLIYESGPLLGLYDLKTEEESTFPFYGTARNPIWSPDETRVALAQEADDHSAFTISVVERDGQVSRSIESIPPAVYCGWPAWSPSGDTLIFHCNQDGNYSVMQWSLTTNRVSRLFEGQYPVFNESGLKIYFSRLYPTQEGDLRLFSYDLNTGELMQLTF